MDDSSNIIFDRIMLAVGLRRDSQLAELLGVSPQAVSQARHKERIPDGWILKLSARFQLSTDWLCYGLGSPTAVKNARGEKSEGEKSEGVKSEGEKSGDEQTEIAALPAPLPGSISGTKVNYARRSKPQNQRHESQPGRILAETSARKLTQHEQALGESLAEANHSMTARLGKPRPRSKPGKASETSSVTSLTVASPHDFAQQQVAKARISAQGNAFMPPLDTANSTLSRYAEVAMPPSAQSRNEADAQGHAENLLDVALIPLVGARLAAGAGSLETDADVQGYFAFRQDWLCRKGNPERMVLMKVFGDSMEPDIHHGDMVLVNQGHTQIFGHAIYAVGVNEEIYIKQVETRPGGLLRLRSLNPRYEPIEINLHGDLENSVRIIGRVIWWCREA